MTMLTRKPDAVAALIRESQRIALCCHVNPDGDTLGSALALRLGLISLGKDAEVFCQDKTPDILRSLAGIETVRVPEEAQGRFDLLISIDVSDEKRMGRCISLMDMADRTAQIDHHGTNPCFMQVNSVDPASPATAVLIREQLSALGVALDSRIAACLYAGLSTDTGNFAFASTTAETFRVMAELMEAGLQLGEMNRQLFRQRAKAQVQLLNRALSTLEFHRGGQVTLMTLTRKDFEECGALPEHADMVVNYGLDIEGVKASAMLRENGDGKVKVSFRAVEPARVDRAAASFGGGGHAQASGATMDGPLITAKEQVLAALIRALDEDNE
ncbi:MAG: bifunctional oligoribonuclease/PAP phosphatase NrnA [Clostridia bacterium]|nr:bifunctional oligoribonuclease/PAP phosphatase NrnA [Clostridia bacterium]